MMTVVADNGENRKILMMMVKKMNIVHGSACNRFLYVCD